MSEYIHMKLGVSYHNKNLPAVTGHEIYKQLVEQTLKFSHNYTLSDYVYCQRRSQIKEIMQ